MSRKKAELQVNSFVGGLNTEQNLLHANPNTSYDEVNMDINRDQSRSRRLGFDLETSAVIHDSNYFPSSSTINTSMFKWDNAGGDPNKSLLVVQVGLHLAVYDLDYDPISSGLVYSTNLTPSSYIGEFDYSAIDGYCVVTTGEKDIYILTYDLVGKTVTSSTDRLLIRDFFGIQVTADGLDLSDPNNVDYRPSASNFSSSWPHVYNIRNQSYAYPHYTDTIDAVTDTLYAYLNASVNTIFPSNADNITQFIYPNTASTVNKTVDRYWPGNNINTPIDNSKASKGFFVIDALDRSTSRLSALTTLQNRYSLSYQLTSLPTDITQGGASVTVQHSGRVFFSGFSGDINGGDKLSPQMSSYLLFSKIVRSKSDIVKCYQAADPTSYKDSALADDDGGFIKLDGAFGISALTSFRGVLFVFAKNGIWTVSGTNLTPFSATNYQVQKISHFGCESAKSVVQTNEAIYYWSRDSIQQITVGQVGIQTEDLTKGKIAGFYNSIDFVKKYHAQGFYDNYERRVHWIYNTIQSGQLYSDELVYNPDYQAFSVNKVETSGGIFPIITSVSQVNPYTLAQVYPSVTVNGVDVTAGGVIVTSADTTLSNKTHETIYLVLTDNTTSVKYSFGKYRRTDFYDWSDYLATPVDSGAYIITAMTTGGDPRSRKEIPYLYLFQKQNGYNSSCTLRTQWDWSISINSNKWSVPREAYKYTAFDAYDLVVSSKNKIRGSGKSFAFKLEAAAGKDLHLYGWSFTLNASSEE